MLIRECNPLANAEWVWNVNCSINLFNNQTLKSGKSDSRWGLSAQTQPKFEHYTSTHNLLPSQLSSGPSNAFIGLDLIQKFTLDYS